MKSNKFKLNKFLSKIVNKKSPNAEKIIRMINKTFIQKHIDSVGRNDLKLYRMRTIFLERELSSYNIN